MNEKEIDRDSKIEQFRARLRHSLSARFLLRYHAGMILLFSIFAGWITDVAMLRLGLDRMAIRYPLAVICAYGAFYLGVMLWIEFSGIREYINAQHADLLVGEQVPGKFPGSGEPWEWYRYPDLLGCMPAPEGCLFALGVIGALIAAFYFFGGYLIANALAFFVEIVLELLLAAGLLHGLHKYESSGWMTSVWRSTRWTLAFALFMAIVLGFLAQNEYPKAKTLPEVVKYWRAS